jgi:hypothetical protein
MCLTKISQATPGTTATYLERERGRGGERETEVEGRDRKIERRDRWEK